MNVLFITLDQFRADSYGAAGLGLAPTPSLDRIASEGVRLTRHFSQAAPCSPGRAALYTGTYQMNNRVVANGTPSPAHLENIATVARRAGFDPTLFGYTDQGVDPRFVGQIDDPRLDSYDGVLPGFSIGCFLPENQAPWVAWLRSLGHDVPEGWRAALAGEPDRPAELSLGAFLTDRFLRWLDEQESGWFAHISHLRPHPPYAAAGRFARLVDPADVELPIPPVEASQRHALHARWLELEASAAPTTEDEVRAMRAQYYGMVAEIDSQLARVIEAIEARGEWDDTLVVVTSDHGEQLGDHGLKEKLGFFPQSYHIIGLWRDPRHARDGVVIDEFTENVDLLATLCDALGVEAPASADGRSLSPLLRGEGDGWRTAAHYEWDWRSAFVGRESGSWPTDRRLARHNLAVTVNKEVAYVQFGNGGYACFDLLADPTWRTRCVDDARTLAAAQELLIWRQQHLNRDMTDLLLEPGRPGRWPIRALSGA
jgi:arylsulfatase A-like enzyme